MKYSTKIIFNKKVYSFDRFDHTLYTSCVIFLYHIFSVIKLQ